MKLYNTRKKELNDKAVLNLLQKAKEWYEDGAISECEDALIDIITAIQEFENGLN